MIEKTNEIYNTYLIYENLNWDSFPQVEIKMCYC